MDADPGPEWARECERPQRAKNTYTDEFNADAVRGLAVYFTRCDVEAAPVSRRNLAIDLRGAIGGYGGAKS